MPKGDDRDVPLSTRALDIAKRMLEANESRWLFPSPLDHGVKDDRLRSSRLWGQLKRAKKLAGVARGTLHSFRHFFVSTMANANVSPFKVMKIVGHRSLDIILTYYHVSHDELLSAVDGVDFSAAVSSKKEKSEK
jgi:integrase